MLQDRELVGVVADVVKELLHECRRDLSTADGYRFLDGSPFLVSSQLRNQVLAVVDGLGETRQLGAIAEIIGSHRDRHVDRQLGIGDSVEQ